MGWPPWDLRGLGLFEAIEVMRKAGRLPKSYGMPPLVRR